MSLDLRLYPRYSVDLRLQVEVAVRGELLEFAGTARMLSHSSVELACEPGLLQALRRQPQLPQLCTVLLPLLTPGLTARLAAQVYAQRRLSQQDYMLILQFRHDDAAQTRLLERMLDRLDELQLQRQAPSLAPAAVDRLRPQSIG